jgi:hypothetical protein
MSLQGSLETFALQDVLKLLAATRKTGELQVRTKRSTGALWVRDGVLVGGNVGDSHFIVESVFALLRSNRGTFSFLGDRTPIKPADPIEVETVLLEVELRLQEWHEIEEVVPSIYCILHLVPEVNDDVRLTPEDWSVVSRVGSGTTVFDLMKSLAIDEFIASRRVKRLSELGVLVIGAPTDEEPLFYEPETDVEFLSPVNDESEDVEEGAQPEPEPDDADTVARWDEIRRIAKIDDDQAEDDLTPEEQERVKEIMGDEAPDSEEINRGVLLKLLASAQTSA